MLLKSPKTKVTNWYLAKLVYHIEIEEARKNTQFDEQYKIIEAVSEEEAFFKARVIGKREESVFENKHKHQVNWKFIDVAAIQVLSDLKDGSQVFSNTHESEEPNDYIRFVKHKAMLIQAESQVYA